MQLGVAPRLKSKSIGRQADECNASKIVYFQHFGKPRLYQHLFNSNYDQFKLFLRMLFKTLGLIISDFSQKEIEIFFGFLPKIQNSDLFTYLGIWKYFVYIFVNTISLRIAMTHWL